MDLVKELHTELDSASWTNFVEKIHAYKAVKKPTQAAKSKLVREVGDIIGADKTTLIDRFAEAMDTIDDALIESIAGPAESNNPDNNDNNDAVTRSKSDQDESSLAQPIPTTIDEPISNPQNNTAATTAAAAAPTTNHTPVQVVTSPYAPIPQTQNQNHLGSAVVAASQVTYSNPPSNSVGMFDANFGKTSIVEQGHSVYIGNVLPTLTTEFLASTFCRFGEIDHVHIAVDKATGHSKGFAFVHFKAIESQQAALAAGGLEISGHVFEIRRTTSKGSNKTSVYLGGLPLDITEAEVKVFVLERLGCPMNCIFGVDLKRNVDGSCKGFGFVELASETLAQDALAKLNNAPLKDRVVACSWASFKKDTPPTRERTVYIANLSQQTTEGYLRSAFAQFGVVGQVTIARNADQTLKGYAFVDFDSREACEAAIAAFNNQTILGNTVHLSIAKPRANQNAAGGGMGNVNPMYAAAFQAAAYNAYFPQGVGYDYATYAAMYARAGGTQGMEGSAMGYGASPAAYAAFTPGSYGAGAGAAAGYGTQQQQQAYLQMYGAQYGGQGAGQQRYKPY